MEPKLKGALELDSPDACRTYYCAWADTYDTGFARDMDYRRTSLNSTNRPRPVGDVFEGRVVQVPLGTSVQALP